MNLSLRPLLVCLLALPQPLLADEASVPKLGPDAVPIMAETAFLRDRPAPDYWAFSPFVRPQFTTSACGIAAVTAALNGLAGLPPLAETEIPDQPAVLAAMGNPLWVDLTAEGGDGITFDQLSQLAAEAALALDIGIEIAALPAATASDADLRALLVANEGAASDAVLVYFNQGVVTGDWDGPHVALIGAFDDATGRVLILEVDQAWYPPYWTDFDTLLTAMRRATTAEHGVLEGQTGGLVHLRRAG